MIKDNGNTSKAAVAGLIIAVAVPCLSILYFFLADNGLDALEAVLANSIFVMPFIALLLSIAGIIVSKTKNKNGMIPGLVGLTLSSVEIIILIISISDTLTRMQDYTPI